MKDQLTPIEEENGIFLKRDDYFVLGNCNGGKLRQAINLIEGNLKIIRTKHNNEVVCFVSIKSPQSAIISEVCKMYGIKCKIICYKTKEPNRNLSIAQENGAEIIGINIGHSTVLEHHAKKQQGFQINMGFKSEIAINSAISQVENIPDELDYLIIPVGSAMNFIGILKGVLKYNKKVGKIIGVYVGKKPDDNIYEMFKNSGLNFEFIKSEYSYGLPVNKYSFLDPIYEAKAWKWMKENIDPTKKTLFWIIGKRNLTIIPQEIKYKSPDGS